MEITLANHAACIARIEKRGGIGKEEARALLEAVGERAEEMRRTGLTDPVVDAAWAMSQKLTVEAEARKADALLNARIKQRHVAEVIRQGIRNGVDYLLGTLYWQAGKQLKDSVQTAAKALSHGWASSLYAMVEKEGLLKVMGNPTMFAEISRELWDLRTGAATIALPKATPARKIAEAIFQHQEAMRDRLNAAGARIAKALDWIATTSHDDYLIRRGGRDVPPITDVDQSYRAWRDFVAPKLHDDTFRDLVITPPMSEAGAREKFLREVYNALVDGLHLTEHRVTSGNPRFEGTRNIARAISQGRVLLWKDADSWSSYMGRYGKSTNWASLMEHSIERAGRQSALMERWGTNPAGNLNEVLQRVREHFHRAGDLDGVRKFDQYINSRWGVRLDTVMAHLDGRSNIATNEMAATIGRTVREFYDVTLLGAVQLTHASSLISTLPSELRWHGINAFESLGGLVASVFRGVGSDAERLDMLAELRALGDGMAREAFDPFSRGAGRDAPGWGVPGYISATHNRFMHMTGLPYLFNSAKRGVREMIASKLARFSADTFDKMPAKLQQTLRSYGIADSEWEMLRQGTLTKAQNNSYLTPATPKSIPSAVIENSLLNRGLITMNSARDVIDAAVAGERRNMADHLAMLYEDAASHSVVESGVRERAFLQGNEQRGSWRSELLQGVMQFKTWPIAALAQVMGREYYQSASMAGFAAGALMVVALSMAGGYLRMTARDLMYNQSPRVPRSFGEAGKIALAALAQGGGLGIFGDYLFGEAARNDAGFAGTLAGPVASDLSNLYGIYNRYLQSIGSGQKVDVLPDLTRFAIGHIPFANLVYLKSMLDYGAWWHIYNWEKPGYWDRYNQRMLKTQGRATFGYRPGTPIPYLPPAIGMALGTQH